MPGSPPPFQPNHHVHFAPLKRVQSATDSDGNRYSILVQGEEMSCAMAAAAMIAKMRQHGASPTPETEAHFKKVGAKFAGSLVESDKLWATNGQTGANVENICALLNSIGIATTKKWRAGKTSLLPDAASLSRPAIMLWGWYPHGVDKERKGGHFTVAARIAKSGNIVVLDPWYGRLSEIAPGANYDTTGVLDYFIYT